MIYVGMLLKVRFYIFLTVVGLISALALFAYLGLKASLPVYHGVVVIPELKDKVIVNFDQYAVPEILAGNRLDAIRALGLVTAQERMFQMDLLRRKSAGRLAEIFGRRALTNDLTQRELGFDRTATRIVAALPMPQRGALEAYAQGVNQYLAEAKALPPEFTLIGYQPEVWTPKDSILVALNMFQLLSWVGPEERMLSMMEQCLPSEVAAFLTPDTDIFSTQMLGGSSARPIREIPIKALQTLAHRAIDRRIGVTIYPEAAIRGSNNWVVSGLKTNDGRAILANDMHLPLSVPNIWYRTVLRYAEVRLFGVTLPGAPILVAGSNDNVAWGFTNLMADAVDLVKLQINPKNGGEYQTPTGWEKFGTIRERIRVKSGQDIAHDVRTTRWGPVAAKVLLGHPVAIKWTALEPGGVDLELLNMDRVKTVEQGIAVMNRAGSPPMNVVLADSRGHIGWTLMGRIPKRIGLDGSVSRFWVQEGIGWEGYLKPWELPRIVDPASGFLATANNRIVGRRYPFVIGHNYAHDYRAYRISERLNKMQNPDEKKLADLQLDTRSEIYEFYRLLAVDLINQAELANEARWISVRDQLLAWDGMANSASKGLDILVAFRKELLKKVFAPYLKVCSSTNKEFVYRWFKMDTPLRQLLTAKLPETLPYPNQYHDWDSFLFDLLRIAVGGLIDERNSDRDGRSGWGWYNRAEIAHPLAGAVPGLDKLLNMSMQEVPGCSYCIRVARKLHGASERFVVSPGQPERGIFQMPGGQSGHFGSPHYADHQDFWANGVGMPYMPSGKIGTLLLSPQ